MTRTSLPHPPAVWWWIIDPRQSLRARAALWVGATMLIFSLLLTWIAGILLQKTLQHQVNGTLEMLAFQMSDKLDRALFERIRTLRLAANLGVLTDSSMPAAGRRRILEGIQEATPEFAWLGMTDATGRILASTDGLFGDLAMNQRAWFRGARQRVYIRGPIEQPDLARHLTSSTPDGASALFLDIAVPVLDREGEFAGVLAGHLHWDWARNVQVSVISEAIQRDRIGVTVYAGRTEVLLDSGVTGWTEPPEAPAIPESSRLSGIVIEHAGGTPYVSAYVRSRGYQDFRGLGWLTVMRQPMDRAYLPVAELRRSIAGWGVGLALVGSIGGWMVAGRFARKLRSITATADRIRGGDILAVMPGAHGPGEVDRMCGALGTMVDDFRKRQDALTPSTEDDG